MILEFSNEWSPALNRGKKQIFQNLKRSFSHEMISRKSGITVQNYTLKYQIMVRKCTYSFSNILKVDITFSTL